MDANMQDRRCSGFTMGITATIWAMILVLYGTPVLAAFPGSPIIGPASGGYKQVTINFTAPASDGGSPITSYTVTPRISGTPVPGLAVTGSSSPITVTGLTNGTTYTFAVTATNSDGTGPSVVTAYNTTPRLYAPTTGTINNLVVFIRFSDQPEFSRPLSYYDGLFNSASNSLKNFYLENSYNTLTVSSTFYPSSSGTVTSYPDSFPTTYYQPYNATTNPGGYQTGAEGTDRETALVTNALAAISAQIPAGLNLDSDSDGYIDHICFEVYSTDLNPLPVKFYSRASYDTSGGILLKGLKVGSYTWVTASQDQSPLYFAATEIHEMGHSFGYPDLRGNFGRIPVGDWDVMSMSKPVHSGAYLKNKFTNWIASIPEIGPTAYGLYSINDLTQATNNSYKIKIPNKSEFLILEYRKATGPFEANLPRSGLCITRVNEAAGIWGNMNGNPGIGTPFFLYYFRPGGALASDGASNAFACLNAETGRTQFNDYSTPACFLSDGSLCGISINNIGNTAGSSISFTYEDPATTTITRLVSGYLQNGGNRVSGATITLSGSASGVTTTDSLGRYFFTVNEGGSYTVTPTKTYLTFNPSSSTFNNVTSDQIQNFTATNNPNTLSGTITSGGTPLSGVTVTCSVGSCPPPVTTDASGTYSFTVNAGGNYDVSPAKANYFFTPNKKSFTTVAADQVQDFSTWTATVTLSGTVTLNGNPLSGVTVSCPGANTATPITTDGSGTYSFTVTVGNGSVYTVTPSSASHTFSPANKFYTGLISNQVQNFTATAITNYTVSFTSNGGSAVSSQSVANNSTATAPAAPTRTGYTFAGWYADAGLTSSFSFVTAITADTTLYAKWTINSYTVSFVSNGSSVVSSQSVAYNTMAIAPTAPTRTGYTFAGWYVDAGLTSAFDFATAITADITLYAKWAINSYTVSFTSSGGNAVSSQSVSYNTMAIAPSAPTRTGHTFAGWYTDAGFTTAFSLATAITADTTLYAKWTITNYTVSFVSNGSSVISSQSITYSSTVTVPTAPTRTGHTFAGWYTDAGLTSVFSFATPITADTTLYAKWTINTYTVSFASNGGSAVSSQSITYSSTVSVPTAPTRTGFTFAGWYTDAGLTSAFDFITPITVDTTLYAKWTINTYTVSFASNGANVNPPSAQTVTHGSATNVTITPVAGYGILSVSGCNGTMSVSSFTTGAITADCTISVTTIARTARSGGAAEPTINDARKVLQAVISITPLDATEQIRYDVAPLGANGAPVGNGILDAADIILILRRSIGIGSW